MNRNPTRDRFRPATVSEPRPFPSRDRKGASPPLQLPILKNTHGAALLRNDVLYRRRDMRRLPKPSCAAMPCPSFPPYFVQTRPATVSDPRPFPTRDRFRPATVSDPRPFPTRDRFRAATVRERPSPLQLPILKNTHGATLLRNDVLYRRRDMRRLPKPSCAAMACPSFPPCFIQPHPIEIAAGIGLKIVHDSLRPSLRLHHRVYVIAPYVGREQLPAAMRTYSLDRLATRDHGG